MIRSSILTLVALLPLAGCSGDSANTPNTGIPKASPSPAAKAVMLAADPGPGASVFEAREAGPKDDIVLVGRVRMITKGVMAFTLIDEELPYCGEQCKEGCPTPWDYCCETKDTIQANLVAVEARGADGKVIKTEALPDLRNLDKVKVKGQLTKDEHGNFALLAQGIYRVERPELPANLVWPQ